MLFQIQPQSQCSGIEVARSILKASLERVAVKLVIKNGSNKKVVVLIMDFVV